MSLKRRLSASPTTQDHLEERHPKRLARGPPARYRETLSIPRITYKSGCRLSQDAEGARDHEKCSKAMICQRLDHVLAPPPILPASQFKSDGQGHTLISESDAITALLKEWDRVNAVTVQEDVLPSFVTFRLNDFTIYRTKDSRLGRAYEMESLALLQTKSGVDGLLFDGTLSYGKVSCRVEAVNFSILAVDGYLNLDVASVVDGVSILSRFGTPSRRQIWYALDEPSGWYARFYEPFLWVANLAKHFMDYVSEKRQVSLLDFKHDFAKWIRLKHTGIPSVRDWLTVGPGDDFRTALVANYVFLWKEYYSVSQQSSDLPTGKKLKLWREIFAEELSAIEEQPRIVQQTVVTPYVFECFKNMFFANALMRKSMSPTAAQEHDIQCKLLGFDSHNRNPQPGRQGSQAVYRDLLNRPSSVQVGDVVAVRRDQSSEWKDESDTWFAYIQGVRTQSNTTFLEVIWLYRPSDTFLAKMNYPHANELFLSDNCNCGHVSIRESEVIRKVNLIWDPPDPSKTDGIFVRQKYLTNDHAFVSIADVDFNCRCKVLHSESQRELKVNDTVYIWDKSRQRNVLEPVVVTQVQHSKRLVEVRSLLRRNRDLGDRDAPLNELVWTGILTKISISRVVGKYHLKCLSEPPLSSSLFARNGTGHLWFFRSRLQNGQIRPCEKCPEEFSSDPQMASLSDVKKLCGLDLFSGGGNFGRGIKEGGVVDMKYAVDFDKIAAHTYRANLKREENPQIFLGSVNDYLAQALDCTRSDLIAHAGQVDVIVAGSPCRAFSPVQLYRLSKGSIRNASLVASAAAFIDFYRPRYALLENVASMASNCRAYKGENVFSQLLCCLVGMGYQVSIFNLDAWSFGAPQSRSRLFIALAAPGLKPMEHPQLSHSHPPGTPNKSLGSAVNGETFGDRKFGPTPFTYVTAEEATRELPRLFDARAGICTQYPDHRIVGNNNHTIKSIISQIPVHPWGQSFRDAVRTGTMSEGHQEYAKLRWRSSARVREDSRMLTRVKPNGFFRTVTRCPNPADGITGVLIHWQEHRWLTIMEARRAQGLPDHEVLIGSSNQQWATVGDAVSRHVALALGLSLREAWLANATECRVKGSGLSNPATTVVEAKLSRKSGALQVVVEKTNFTGHD